MIRSLSTTLTAGLFALAALPAAAQDANLCGGAGSSGQWLGGDEASSDISISPSFVEQMALVLMRNEYVGLFTVSQDGDYRIEAQGNGGGDTVLDVRNAAGDIVASDDDSGGEGASRTEVFLTAGTYCASMRSFDGTPLTGFVRAARVDQEALTPGFGTPSDGGENYNTGTCDLGAAVPLTLGEPIANAWSAQNMYSLQLDAPMAISLTAENETADPILSLYDASGNWIAENDDFDGLNSRIDVSTPLEAGTYCVAVNLYGDENVPITVLAKEYDALEVQVGLYARGDASPPLDGSYPVTALGELQTRLRQDANVGGDATWFSFDVFEGGLVLVEAIAQGQGDPVLIMYDDLGRQVGYNDDNGGSLDSLLTVRVQPGTYAVAVKQLDSGTTGMIRMLFERYVPARP
ncbi:DVUA0089 family protein [Octadecabacter sp. 1_MG-2023]|uniref:DVUA0089 family protein n=1 Tax=unclassified Octadecabacter TaxID=196158 RepID=UPI001C092783|nr:MULTISPECIES: DVUA0089 family protein [unclassified Octadecabacter]MBU2992094.1 DVUA0089 family protein [Octadecabacter sp. B2R22]MDO6735149.1 DVUA0089 family protein [Octadecabacter sp. 1_MG-2023]